MVNKILLIFSKRFIGGYRAANKETGEEEVPGSFAVVINDKREACRYVYPRPFILPELAGSVSDRTHIS